jgi:hypothetical protein
MDVLRSSIKTIKKTITPIRLNLVFLLVNIIVGIAIKNTPLIISSSIALLCVFGLSLKKPITKQIVKIADQVVVASVMIAIFVMWFDTHHHIRTLSGLILLYAFGIFLTGKLNDIYNSKYSDIKGVRKWIYEILHYFGSFGHFLFNLEYALLVLI